MSRISDEYAKLHKIQIKECISLRGHFVCHFLRMDDWAQEMVQLLSIIITKNYKLTFIGKRFASSLFI